MQFFSSVFNDIIGNAVLCVACTLFLSYLRGIPPKFEKKRMALAGIILSVGAFISRYSGHFITPPTEEGKPPLIQQALSAFVLEMDYNVLTTEEKLCLKMELLNSLIGIISICAGAFILMRIFRAKHIAPMVAVQVVGFLIKEVSKTPYENLIAGIFERTDKFSGTVGILEKLERDDAIIHGYNAFGYGCFMILILIFYIIITRYMYKEFWTKEINVIKHILSLAGLITVYTMFTVAGDIILAQFGLRETTDGTEIIVVFDLAINVFLAAALLIVPWRTYRITLGELQNKFYEVKRSEEVELYEYSRSKPLSEGLKKYIHDLPKHFRAIDSIAVKIGADEISQYINELSNELAEAKCEFSTGNVNLDDLLAEELNKAAEKGTAIVFSGAFPNEGIKQKDISTIFYNLLENAIEACSLVTGRREIKITSNIHENRVYVNVSNPFEQEIKKSHGKFSTTKKNKEFHGYGLSNVKKVVEKKEYDGTFEIEKKDNIFYAKFDMKFSL